VEQKPNLSRLTGPQLISVLAAAQTLNPRVRERFLESIARTLADRDEPGDGDVDRAIRAALAALHAQRLMLL
jgi:hypothetical protein